MDIQTTDSGLEPTGNGIPVDGGEILVGNPEPVHTLDSTWRSGMFRPGAISGMKMENGDWVCIGGKYCLLFPDPLYFLNCVRIHTFVNPPVDAKPFDVLPCSFNIAGHKGALCISFANFPELNTHSVKVFKVCNSFKEPEEEFLPCLTHGREYRDGLLHMRVGDNGQDYKILVAGKYTGDTSCYTFVYDSQNKKWEQARNPNWEGLTENFQNGALYKSDDASELLFCISTPRDTTGNRGVSMYNLMTQSWTAFPKPRIVLQEAETIGRSDVLQPLGVEECGGMIFLFSECRLSEEDVLFYIHVLKDVNDAQNAWEEVTRKKRSPKTGNEFTVYPRRTSFPLGEVIQTSGGCLFVFDLTFSMDGNSVSIHDLNCSGVWNDKPLWNDKQLTSRVKVKGRVSNWADVPGLNQVFEMSKNEADEMQLKGAEKWVYISTRIFECGGFERSPKQCQQKADTDNRSKVSSVAEAEPTPSGSSLGKKGKRALSYSTSGKKCRSGLTVVTQPPPISAPDPAFPVRRYSSAVPSNPDFTGRPFDNLIESRGKGDNLDHSETPRMPPIDGPGPGFLSRRSSSLAEPLPQDSASAQHPSASDGPEPAPATGRPARNSLAAGFPSEHIYCIDEPRRGPSSAADVLPASNTLQPLDVGAPLPSLTPSPNPLASPNRSDSFDDMFRRVIEALKGIGKELTVDHASELWTKVDDLDLLKETVISACLSDLELPISKFSQVVDRLKGQLLGTLTEEKCFEMLSKGLDTDWHRYKRLQAGTQNFQ